MVATPRSTPEDQALGDPSQGVSETDRATEILRVAMDSFSAARDERLRTEILRERVETERRSLDLAIGAVGNGSPSSGRLAEPKTSTPTRSSLGWLQFVAGCALAGVVLTGIALGHDVAGFDPGYVGGALGVVVGGFVWATRGP